MEDAQLDLNMQGLEGSGDDLEKVGELQGRLTAKAGGMDLTRGALWALGGILIAWIFTRG